MRLETGIDYLSFTLKTGGLPLAFKILGETPEPLQSYEIGLYGYKLSFRCPGVTVLYSADRNDVHIQLTGSACTFYGARLLTMVPDDANVARCDIRCDVLGGYMSVDEIWGYLRRRCYSGTARTIQFITTNKSDEYAGSTIYFGASSSDVRLRVYDKGAETGTSKNPRRWLRFEFQTRRLSAVNAYLSCIRQGISACFLSFLHKTVRLTERSADTLSQEKHRERLKTLKKWSDTFKERVKVIYHSQRKSPSFAGMMNHLKNCGAILKVLRSCRHDFEELLHDFADRGKLKEHHMILARELKQSLDLSDEWGCCYA